MNPPLRHVRRRTLRPLDLVTMTPAQCKAAQRALLYPWERARFDEAEVVFQEKDTHESDRACLYVMLDRRLDDALEETYPDDGTKGWWSP